MDTLNKELLINYISTKQMKYKERRDKARIEGRLTKSNDYEIRLLPLNNLLNRIMRGEFDAKSEPEKG